jgi:hypothetical protein
MQRVSVGGHNKINRTAAIPDGHKDEISLSGKIGNGTRKGDVAFAICVHLSILTSLGRICNSLFRKCFV